MLKADRLYLVIADAVLEPCPALALLAREPFHLGRLFVPILSQLLNGLPKTPHAVAIRRELNARSLGPLCDMVVVNNIVNKWAAHGSPFYLLPLVATTFVLPDNPFE